MEIDWNSEDAKKVLAEAVEKETAGLKANREAILTEKQDLEAKVTSLDQLLEGAGGPDGIKALVELKTRMDADEETRLIAEGKLEEVLQRKLEPERAARQKLIDQMAELEQRERKTKERYQRTLLDNRIAQDVTGLQDGAASIATRLAAELFTVDDNDQIVPRNGVPDVDGQPLTTENFKQYLLAQHPYLFQPAQGGMGRPAAGAGGVSQLRRADYDRLTTPEQRKFVHDGGKIIDG